MQRPDISSTANPCPAAAPGGAHLPREPAASTPVTLPERGDPPSAPSRSTPSGQIRPRELEPEHAPASRLLPHSHFAAVGEGEALDGGEAQADAGLRRAVAADVGLEDLLPQLGGDSRAVVLDLEVH